MQYRVGNRYDFKFNFGNYHFPLENGDVNTDREIQVEGGWSPRSFFLIPKNNGFAVSGEVKEIYYNRQINQQVIILSQKEIKLVAVY